MVGGKKMGVPDVGQVEPEQFDRRRGLDKAREQGFRLLESGWVIKEVTYVGNLS